MIVQKSVLVLFWNNKLNTQFNTKLEIVNTVIKGTTIQKKELRIYLNKTLHLRNILCKQLGQQQQQQAIVLNLSLAEFLKSHITRYFFKIINKTNSAYAVWAAVIKTQKQKSQD